jgi:signal peptide peptidase SppA
MAKNRHWNGQGFYRPDSYFGPWSIIPDSLNHFLAIVGTLDLAAMATAAAKSDSPSTPLPTLNPDLKEKKQAGFIEKKAAHEKSAADIADHEKDLAAKKDAKSKTDQDEIDKSEKSLAEKKKNHAALTEDLESCRDEMDDTETPTEQRTRIIQGGPGSGPRPGNGTGNAHVQDKWGTAHENAETKEEHENAAAYHDARSDRLRLMGGKGANAAAQQHNWAGDKHRAAANGSGSSDSANEATKQAHNVERREGLRSELVLDGGLPGQLPAQVQPSYELTDNGTAILTMSGPITKYPTSFQAVIGGASTVMTQNAIRKANADDAVARIALVIDSPGGTCAGIYEFMQEVSGSKKPLWVYGEDTLASAAYFAATNASYIACTPTAMIGSVGTLLMLKDTSGAYKLDGIKVMAIGTGVHKGAGMDGTEITDEQKSYFQSIVDETNTTFVQAVKTSRELSDEQFADVTKAGVYIGAKAVTAGLVDGVMSFEQFLTKFEADTDKNVMEAAAQNANRIKIEMKSRELLAQMIAAGIPQALAIAEYTAGHTLEQAQQANAQAIQDADKIREKFGVSASDGQTPVELKEKTVDNVQATFMQTVEEHLKSHPKMPKREAISQMISAHPDLYESWKKSFPVAQGISGK